jgi:hypothetical protein
MDEVELVAERRDHEPAGVLDAGDDAQLGHERVVHGAEDGVVFGVPHEGQRDADAPDAAGTAKAEKRLENGHGGLLARIARRRR